MMNCKAINCKYNKNEYCQNPEDAYNITDLGCDNFSCKGYKNNDESGKCENAINSDLIYCKNNCKLGLK